VDVLRFTLDDRGGVNDLEGSRKVGVLAGGVILPCNPVPFVGTGLGAMCSRGVEADADADNEGALGAGAKCCCTALH